MAGSRVPEVVAAAVSALQADAGLTALLGTAKTYTHVPQGTDPPFVTILGGDELPWSVTFEAFADVTVGDAGDNGGRTCDVLAQCVSTYRGTEKVDSIASRVLEVLTNDATWTDVSGFQLAEFVRNTALPPSDVFNDGKLWFQRTVVVRVALT